MSLHPGSRLGPFEILSAIGAGGMGEVYRARDTKLGRDVAIKVLPSVFTADPERRARFEREARLISQLNHANICALYHVSDAPNPESLVPNPDPIQFLVFELVEGETLRERLIRGALPLDEALRYATAIADALEAAHEKGIIHRDLKPSNIKITPVGSVKVLDFGLAKVAGSDGSGPDLTQSPTITMGGMHDGVILGTAAYMSPEQTRGKFVDKRADIWAFGCVLYEMLVGRPAFEGDTLSDTIASILDREPDWRALPEKLPQSIGRLLQRCLEKEAKRRLRDIGNVRIDLEDALTPATSAISSGVDREKSRGARAARWLVAGLVLGAIAVGSIALGLRPATGPDLGVVRFTIEPPTMSNPYAFSISPDGRTVAFAARRSDGRTMLFVRPIGSVEARPLPGTEYAFSPFWSHDSRYLGFATTPTTRQLKIVDVGAGRPQVVCDLRYGNPFAGTWSSDNVIVFSDGGSLYRVPATGGTPARLSTPDRSAGEVMHLQPEFLPDGRRFLYLALNANSPSHGVMIGSLDSGPAIQLMRADSMARYAPPHFLLFARQQTLLAQQFDASTLTLAGEPTAIAEAVLYRAGIGRAAFDVSDAGTLLYRTGGTELGQRSLVWIDRRGRISEPDGESITGEFIRLSPDGKRLAFAHGKHDGVEDIWVYDLQRNLRFPVTSHPARDHTPVWSPDGLRVGFDSHRGENKSAGLFDTRADGATPDRELLPPEPGTGYTMLDWTSEYIVFSKHPPNGTPELWAQRLVGDRKPFRYLPRATNAALSPDGRWIAYVTNEGGMNQVIVQSFPDPSNRRQQTSPEGGVLPRWRRDGRELFYLDADWRMIAVPIQADGTAAVEKSTHLFTPPGFVWPPNTIGYNYDVTADGQRFLFSVTSANLSTAPITVVLNWTAAMKK